MRPASFPTLPFAEGVYHQLPIAQLTSLWESIAMLSISIRSSSVLVLALAGLILGGCTSKSRTFHGRSADEVWRAMQAVAESPEYDDWHVTENEVWVHDDDARIEVYRETRRLLYRAGAKPLPQRRSWRFQLLLDDTDPPTARFVSRGMAIPGHAQAEADRFFIDLHRTLSPDLPRSQRTKRPSADETARPAADEPVVEDATPVPFDVDDLKD